MIDLRTPSAKLLPAYIAALERGFEPDNVLGPQSTRMELDHIADDPATFLAAQDDRDGAGPAITLPDGSQVQRLPSVTRWIWDDGFCGLIGFRWAVGTEALPPTCPGHIGYAVAPWERGRGRATAALALMLPLARDEGLRFVHVTTDPDNHASQRVIEKNGGRLIELFDKPAALGGGPALRFRIDLVPV
ncbi:MAG TPA: GNAT family N-acetyltransferase [Caulobacteraceae bacterium]|nr:GNAT family N-acetyltransferase [Caulobacteraceae bacterium]